MKAFPPGPDQVQEDDWIHPLDAAALREPIPDGDVLVIVMASKGDPDPDSIGQGLLDLLKARRRKADAFVVRPDSRGWDKALEEGLAGGSQPIVLVTTARGRWSAAHLDPLLEAINLRDHVIGRRPAPPGGNLKRWLATLPWRVLFALPVLDAFSPCRMHRRAALETIVPQSVSRFLEVEILAKATFLTQVIEEVDVPPLESPPVGRIGGDLRAVLKSPVFVRPAPSVPPEDLEGDHERPDGPGGEDRQGDHHDLAGQARPFEHDRPQGVEELGQREGLDEPLGGVGEPLGPRRTGRRRSTSGA